ncbi:hypothetical protein GCM10022396_10410 [Flavivirga amylovorans]
MGFKSAPFRIKIAVPINPTITPSIWRFVDVILKTAKPNKIVFKGTNEFKIETTALSISVSAIAKKKAGIKDPKTPVIIIHFQSGFLIVLMVLNPINKRKKPVIMILKAPN